MPGKRLTVQERAQIEVLFGQGLTFPQIAAAIRRDRTTVWREVDRNNSFRGNSVPAGAWHPEGRRDAYLAGRGYAGRLGGLYRWKYCHRNAQRKADLRACRPRTGKLRPRWGRPWPPLWQLV